MAPLMTLRQRVGSTEASVVTAASMVAMLGWIMPEPLAMPPTLIFVPPMVVCIQHSRGVW